MNELKSFVEEINKQTSANAAILLSENEKIDVDVIPTGVGSIDQATGIGGFPMGRISEVYGKEASGKTTLCLQTIAEAHKMGLNAAFIDMEQAISFDRMEKLGVDREKLVFSQPDSGEQALNLVEMMVRSNNFGIIVIDSVAALVPQSESEKDMGDSSMGVQARLMSQAMRKLAPPVNKSNVALIFINQVRSKIGVSWGNPEVTTGGTALKFYSSLRLKVTYTGKIKEGGVQVASKGKVTVVKNKLAVPYKEAEFEINENGITDDVFFLASLVKRGVIEKAGGWYKFQGEAIGQGYKNTVERIKTDEELYSRVQEFIKHTDD